MLHISGSILRGAYARACRRATLIESEVATTTTTTVQPVNKAAGNNMHGVDTPGEEKEEEADE